MQKLGEAGQTETAVAATPTTLPATLPLEKAVPVSPTETVSGIEPTEEPTLAPAPEPTLELAMVPTLEPTQAPIPEPTQEPTLEPTQEPTPDTLPQPEVSAAQEQPNPTVFEPAYPPAEQLPRSPDRTILRVAEIFMATIALAAGLIAIYLRRIGRG
jgi:hypothetical protein